MTKKSRILIGTGAIALMLVGALCFIPVSVFCTTTTPVMYGTSVPSADDTANSTMANVVGSKLDAAATGAVDTTSSIMAYIKQLITGQITIDAFFDVPTADITTNATVRDVVGNKTDAAAAGAVSETESLMAYSKQLVTGQIILDEFHDVPAANNILNAQINEVIGNKTDTAAAGAVTETDTLVGYIKQLVTAAIDAAAALVVIDEFQDVPAANNVLNAQVNEVIGNKTDTAAAGVVTETDTLVAYAKQNVTNTEAILADTAVMQPVQEMAVSKTLTTIASGVNGLFTVAGGPIKILEIVGYVATEIEAKSCLINYNINPTAPAADTVFGTDATALEIDADAVGTLYTWDGVVANDLTAVTNGVAIGTAAYSGLIVPPGGIELAAVVATSATGAINFYMRYIPLSTGVTVVAQ